MRVLHQDSVVANWRDVHPEGWLDNFLDPEQEHAVHLLGAFLYYSETLVERLFSAAFQRLSIIQARAQGHRDYSLTLSSSWRLFCDRALITYVTGEVPSPTDSGLIFSRMARQVLSMKEARILSPDEVIRRLAAGDTSPVIFVDDFVGSGEQFINTWVRSYDLGGGKVTSFKTLASISTVQFYYCVPFCSALGLSEIKSSCRRSL